MLLLFTLLLQLAFALSKSDEHVLHLAIHRRGGRFVQHEPVNLTYFLDLLHRTEDRYARTHTSVGNNRLVRRWNVDEEDHAMLDDIGSQGRWYTTLHVGSPPQDLNVDIDFLSPDFYTLLTTSDGGSKFNTFASQSHITGDAFVHPLCRLTSDTFHLPGQQQFRRLEWPICQPPKTSRHTLSKSGTILGLAPNPKSHASSLARLTAPSFLHSLHQENVVRSPIWSITLLDSATGVLSIGGTAAAAFEEAKARAEVALKYLGQSDVAKQSEEEVRGKLAFAIPQGSDHESHFKWIDVAGADGWWTGLMSGVFVDGVKILKNQPFIIDLSCPFVLAPPSAFRLLYQSIGGSKPLSSDFSNITTSNTHGAYLNERLKETFHLFPCLNPPDVSLELAGWPFPLSPTSISTRDDAFHGPAGGPFSLGKVIESSYDNSQYGNNSSTDSMHKTSTVNSGYCVGIVVQSYLGGHNEKRWKNSGMRDVWILGEPFFRGLGVVFDDGDGNPGGKARIGFRRY